jgi:peptide/nickel transport system substrate-binding protein
MTRTAMLAASTVLVVAAMSQAVHAETFRWASTTDPQTMDPHAANVAPVTSFLNNIYEGLVRRNADMAIEPSLATAWEPLSDGHGWRFHLRQGVRFHGGEAFTADDVMFSYQRASSEQSDVRSWFAGVSEVRVLDDHTVEFVTNAPNPLFPDSIANFMILDRGWTEANGADVPARDDRPLCADCPGPGRRNPFGPEPRLVGHGHAQCDRGRVQPHRERRDRARGPLVG